MTFLKSIFAGLVILAVAMLAKPFLVRALQLNAGGGGTPAVLPPGSRLPAAPRPMAMARPNARATGNRPAQRDEPADLLDAVIDVRRIEGRINAASTKKLVELLHRHPDLAAQAMRRWLAQGTDSR